GFWYERPAAARAAVKAFWITKLGDVGFIVGIVLLWSATGTFEFTELFEQAQANALVIPGLATIMFLISLGAVGKSAQFPLHVWLPDAMEGPTPVSALIHAATMVTAGVFMVTRTEPLFALVPDVLTLIAWVGAFTALLAATMACVEADIKRVLAYSTVSQVGFMMAAAGAGASAAGFFHLGTHGVFKALLFLGAGAVIHAVGAEHGPDWLAPLSLGLAAAAFVLAWATYQQPIVSATALATLFGPIDFLARRRYGLDALYAGLYRGFILGFSRLIGWIARYLVDGVLNVLSAWTLRSGDMLRRIQSGQAQDYVYGVAFG